MQTNIKVLKEKYDKWYRTHPVSVIIKRIVGLIIFTVSICIIVMGGNALDWYWKTGCILAGTIGCGMIDLFRWER